MGKHSGAMVNTVSGLGLNLLAKFLRRRWGWVRYILSKDITNIINQVLTCIP